jgi:hypothetical protein
MIISNNFQPTNMNNVPLFFKGDDYDEQTHMNQPTHQTNQSDTSSFNSNNNPNEETDSNKNFHMGMSYSSNYL